MGTLPPIAAPVACLPSIGEINKYYHMTCKYPSSESKTNKNQDLKKKQKHILAFCTIFLEGNQQYIKQAIKKSQILTQALQFLGIQSQH